MGTRNNLHHLQAIAHLRFPPCGGSLGSLLSYFFAHVSVFESRSKMYARTPLIFFSFLKKSGHSVVSPGSCNSGTSPRIQGVVRSHCTHCEPWCNCLCGVFRFASLTTLHHTGNCTKPNSVCNALYLQNS